MTVFKYVSSCSPEGQKDIIDAFEMQSDEASSFLDLNTCHVEIVSNDLLADANEFSGEEPDLPDWQRQEWGQCRK